MNNSVQDPMWDCQGEDDVELGLGRLSFSGHDVNGHGHGCEPSFQQFRNPTPVTQYMNMDESFSGPEYAFQLVDTTGQDEYTILPQSYFMNIDCYILVYSVISLRSFGVINFVYDKLLDMKGNIGHIPSILISDMSDLSMEWEVSSDAGRRLTEKWKTPFMETSAKEQFTVSRLFEQIIMTMAKAVLSEKDCVIFLDPIAMETASSHCVDLARDKLFKCELYKAVQKSFLENHDFSFCMKISLVSC